MLVREEGGVSGGPEEYRMVAICTDQSFSEDRLEITRVDYPLNPSMRDELLAASGQELPKCTFNISAAHGYPVMPRELAALAVCSTVGSGDEDTIHVEALPRATRELKSWVFTDSEPSPVGNVAVKAYRSKTWLGELPPVRLAGFMRKVRPLVVALPNPEVGCDPFAGVEGLVVVGGLRVALHGGGEPGSYFETIVGR